MESEVQEVKTLTKELAEKYFRARFSVDLATFHYLEDEAAKIISKKDNSCGLQLDGLCELSEKSAGFLARHVDSISTDTHTHTGADAVMGVQEIAVGPDGMRRRGGIAYLKWSNGALLCGKYSVLLLYI